MKLEVTIARNDNCARNCDGMSREAAFLKMWKFSGKLMEFCIPASKCEPVSVIARACGNRRVYSIDPNLYFCFRLLSQIDRYWSAFIGCTFTTCGTAVEYRSNAIAYDWNDRSENSSRNSRNATISTIPIVIAMCIKKMPLDDSFYGFRAERP